MTKDDLRLWAQRSYESAAKERDYFAGVLAVVGDGFREEDCAPAGSVEEGDFCEGGREAIAQLDPGPPLGRVAHGAGTEANRETWDAREEG